MSGNASQVPLDFSSQRSLKWPEPKQGCDQPPWRSQIKMCFVPAMTAPSVLSAGKFHRVKTSLKNTILSWKVVIFPQVVNTCNFTCSVLVMELRILKTAASRSCGVGYISIFSSSNVKAIWKSGKQWRLLGSKRPTNPSTFVCSRDFN